MARKSLTSLQEFAEFFPSQPVFVGVDVHKRSYAVALLRADGALKEWTTPADPAALAKCLAALPVPIGSVVYEAGPTGFGLARSLESARIPVLVVAPSRAPRPVTRGNKTDRLDSRKLAQYAASGLLRPIGIPTVEEEALRSLVRRRHRLTDSLRQTKQRIRGLLLQFGFAEPPGIDHWGKTAMEELSRIALPPGANITRDSLMRELTALHEERRWVEGHIKQVCLAQGYARRIEALKVVSGVGDVVATTFVAEVFRPERFDRPEELTSYLGLAPVVSQSGEGKTRGKLRPVGQRRLRSLLIESAWIWKQHDERADEIYRHILGRTGVAQKAIVAVARHLAIHLWNLSREPIQA